MEIEEVSQNNDDDCTISASTEGESEEDNVEQQPSRQRSRYSFNSHDAKELLISYYEQGISMKEAAIRARININTGKSIIRAYKRDGELLRARRGGNREKKLTTVILSAIENYVQNNPSITIRKIKQKLKDEQNVSICETTIRNGLKILKTSQNVN